MTISQAAYCVWDEMRKTGKPLSRDSETGLVTSVEISQRDVINKLFPEYKAGPRSTFTNSKLALDWHAAIGIYLKYSGNVVLVKRPSGPHATVPRQSHWRLADNWTEQTDQTVLERARAAREIRDRNSDNPVKVVLSAPHEDPVTSIIRVENDLSIEDAVAVADAVVPTSLIPKPPPCFASTDYHCAEDAGHCRCPDCHDAGEGSLFRDLSPVQMPTPATMPARQEDSVLADPALALTQLIQQRNDMRAENVKLKKQVIDLTTSRDAFKDRALSAERKLDELKELIDRHFRER